MARRDVKHGRVVLRHEMAVEISYYDELERMLGEEIGKLADAVQTIEWGSDALIESCSVNPWVTDPDLRPILVDGPAPGLVCSPELRADVFSVVQATITLYSRVRFTLLNRQDQGAIARLANVDHWTGPGLQDLIEAIKDMEVCRGAEEAQEG